MDGASFFFSLSFYGEGFMSGPNCNLHKGRRKEGRERRGERGMERRRRNGRDFDQTSPKVEYRERGGKDGFPQWNEIDSASNCFPTYALNLVVTSSYAEIKAEGTLWREEKRKRRKRKVCSYPPSSSSSFPLPPSLSWLYYIQTSGKNEYPLSIHLFLSPFLGKTHM